jgi:hypothetical protein
MFEIQRRNGSNALLPSRLRKLLFLKTNEGTLRNLIISGSEREAVDRMEAVNSGLSWLDSAAAVPPYRFYEGIIRDKKFPSVDNLDALFRRFGLDNIVAQMSARIRSDVQLRLKSFIDIRNAIAHESPPALTEDDIERNFKSVMQWVFVIDKILLSHVVKSSGSKYWQV